MVRNRTRPPRGVIPLAAALLFVLGCNAPSAELEPENPLTQAVRKGIANGHGTFSQDDYDALLREYVKPGGFVDYKGLLEKRQALEGYLHRVAHAKIAELSKDQLFALLINAYNAYTLDLILRHYPVDSIKDIPKRWSTPFCDIGGEKVSLDFIEHHLLRVKELFGDPRVHFAVNCASIGCPPLAPWAYRGDRIDSQLDRSVRSALALPRNLELSGDDVQVTMIFKWYREDFVRKAGSVSNFLRPYVSPEVRKVLEKRGDAALSYQDYDWHLNDAAR